jgi:hypothetical protein
VHLDAANPVPVRIVPDGEGATPPAPAPRPLP